MTKQKKWVRAVFPKTSNFPYEEVTPGVYVNHAPSAKGMKHAVFFDSPQYFEPCDPPKKYSWFMRLLTGKRYKL